MREKMIPIRCALIFGGAGFIGCNWAHHREQFQPVTAATRSRFRVPGLLHAPGVAS